MKLIVTGHGKFASGLANVIEVIAGKQDELFAIEFVGQDLEKYTQEMEKIIKVAFEEKKSVIILTDLISGTPFRISSFLSEKYPNVYVVAGTNVPMLIEAVFKRRDFKDQEELVRHLIAVGKNGIESLDNLLRQKSNAKVVG
ncbi:MAG: N-acetylgalactosamine system component [Thermoanaerobacter sp.]|jgi:PTS system N-acetylgalactosamine-specific IIA component|nr:N-acetylgalactosamine system component [Thermoanaerobacter sp.]